MAGQAVVLQLEVVGLLVVLQLEVVLFQDPGGDLSLVAVVGQWVLLVYVYSMTLRVRFSFPIPTKKRLHLFFGSGCRFPCDIVPLQ